MRNRLIAAAATLAAMTAFPAYAVDNGIYLGGSIGQGGVEFDESIDDIEFDYEGDATAYKLIAGWRFLDWLAVEGNYVDLGKSDDAVAGEQIEADVSGISLSAVGFLPIGPVDLFARAGVVDWEADLDSPSPDLSGSRDGTDMTYGLGAQFRVWGLSIRGEYEIFDIEDADRIDMISVGVTWTFL